MTFKMSSTSIFLFICCLATVTVKVTSTTAGVFSPSAQSASAFTSHTSPPSQNLSVTQSLNFQTATTQNLITSKPLFDHISHLADVIAQSITTSPFSQAASSSVLQLDSSTSNCDVTTSFSSWSPSTMSFQAWSECQPAATRAEEAEDERWKLHVVGLFAIDGPYPVGQAFQYAAELAEDDINGRPDVLPGYKIVLESVNTGCDIATGMDVLYQKLYNSSSTKVMVLGGTCSDTTEQTARASRKHNLVQISYSVQSPRLSDRTEFPWFFRVMAPETELSKARVALLQKFNWTTITIIHGSAHIFTSWPKFSGVAGSLLLLQTGELMRNLLQEKDMKVNATYPFDSDLERIVEELKAYRKGFYGEKIVWIFPGFYDLKWYDHDDFNCTAKEKLRVIDGYLTVSNVNMALDEGDTIGATQTEFLERFKCKALQSIRRAREKRSPGRKDQLLKGEADRQLAGAGQTQQEMQFFSQKVTVPGDSRAPLGYDAMWTIALTLNDTLTELLEQGRRPDVLRQFSYSNVEMGEMLVKHMKNTSFRGLSGKVNFTPSGDRIPQIHIKQFQVLDFDDEKLYVELKVIGLYTNPSNIVWNLTGIKWADGEPPPDSRHTEHVLKPLSWQIYLAMGLLAGSGVIVSILFLVFNIRNRHVRLIKMSSPRINNLILVGCMLVYSTVTIVDIHNHQGWACLCHIRQYLMVMGFSLAFGALFAKTWRVYEIMTAAACNRRLNTRALRDSRLYLIVLGLVAVNLGVLVVWTAVDPMHLVRVDIENAEVHKDDDVLEIPQSLECDSKFKLHFKAGLIALQALLILFGAFLTVQTRKVTIPELNDSRWVGLCIYNVVVLGSLGVILNLGTRQSPDVTYLLESLIVLVGTTLTQCLIFMPKLFAFRRLKHGRQDCQRMVTVKTMERSIPLASPYQENAAEADPTPPSNGSNRTPSPSKALRKASRSLSSALKKCCSTDVDQGGVVGKQNKGYVTEGQEGGGRAGQRRVSRAVSTCNLLDMSSMLPAVGTGSGVDVSDHALAQRCVLCSRNPLCADPDILRWIKANQHPPHLPDDPGSVVGSQLPWSDSSQRDGPTSCDPGHVCCSLMKCSGGRGRRPLKRCLSVSSLDQIVVQFSAEHPHGRHDNVCSRHDWFSGDHAHPHSARRSYLTEMNA